jgi:tetratricopeptide (TPR) repeat protein
MLGLKSACAKGQREKAERYFAAIPDELGTGLARTVVGRLVTVTETEARETLDRVRSNADESPVARVRAMLALADSETVDELVEYVDSIDDFSVYFRRHIRIIQALEHGRWQEAVDAIDGLLQRFAGLDVLWSMRADALAELGRLEEARESVSMALEISPKSPELTRRRQRLDFTITPFNERLNAVRDVLDKHPDRHLLRLELAHILLEGADGLEFEAALKDCVRYLPRCPEGYNQLAGWYMMQQREDLARKVLAEGRALIGAEELPLWDFEQDQDNEAGEAAAESAESATSDRKKSELLSELPTAVMDGPAPATPLDIEALRQLVEMREAGMLTWFESSFVLAMHVRALVRSTTPELQTSFAERLAELLPDAMQGPTALALDHTLDSVEPLELPRSAAGPLIEWVDRLTDAESRPCALQFNRAVLRELGGDLNGAESDYRRILVEHKEYMPPQYRLGVIAFERGDLKEAIHCFKGVLSSVPGTIGAMKALVDLNLKANDDGEALRIQRLLTELLPYSFEEISTFTAGVHHVKGIAAAVAAAESPRYETATVAAVKARLLANDEQYDKAIAVLDAAGDVAPHGSHALFTRVQCADAKLDHARINELVDQGLKEWPDEVWLIGMKADRMRETNDSKLSNFLGSALERGVTDPRLTSLYLEAVGDRVAAATGLVGEASDVQRDALAYSCAAAFDESGSRSEFLGFLQWCATHVPHLTELRHELAVQLAFNGDVEAAVAIATTLLEDAPDDPRRLALMATCEQGRDPTKAIEYLNREYALTASADCMCRMAVCEQLRNDFRAAEQTYVKVLERSPCNQQALTGLYMLGADIRDRFDDICVALETQAVAEQPLFHIIAVNVAKQRQMVLPVAWLTSAIERWHRLEHDLDGADERQRIGHAIAAWLSKWGDKDGARRFRPGLMARVKLFGWPGKRWVPAMG